MINGTTVTGHDLVLRTGAWGKDIIVPTAIAAAPTAGMTTVPSLSQKFIGHMHLRNISGILLKRRHLKLEKERQRCLAL